jgi:hypothetical protein
MQIQSMIRRNGADIASTGESTRPTGWRLALWLLLLIASSIALSLGFACAVPFAAFAAVAALTLDRSNALLLIGGVWLANQIVGFAVLDYPWTADTFAWGIVLGIVAILATVAAWTIARRFGGSAAVVASPLAFAGAFIVYEVGLFVVAATLLGGTEDFAWAIVARIFEINAAAFVGLLVINRLGVATGLAARPATRLSAMERHA